MEDPSRTSHSAKLPAVQWARAVAALSVAIGHSLHEATKFADVSSLAGWLKTAIPFQIGVDIFFVISGFIMVYVTHGKLDQPGFAFRFARDRLLRIVPLYWFVTLSLAIIAITLPQALDSTVFSWSRLLHSLMFFPGFGEISVRPLLTLGWTLNYEMFFYLCFFLCILLLRRWTVLALLALLPLFAIAHLAGAFDAAPFKFWASPIVIEFCFGMVIGWLYIRGVRVNFWICLGLVFCATILLAVSLHNLSFKTRFLVFGVPSTLFVAGLALLEKGQHLTPKVFGKIATRLGDASYSLYLLHPFIITAMFIIWKNFGFQDLFGGWGYIFATLISIIGASIFSYHFIERPLNYGVKSIFTRQIRVRKVD